MKKLFDIELICIDNFSTQARAACTLFRIIFLNDRDFCHISNSLLLCIYFCLIMWISFESAQRKFYKVLLFKLDGVHFYIAFGHLLLCYGLRCSFCSKSDLLHLYGMNTSLRKVESSLCVSNFTFLDYMHVSKPFYCLLNY